MAKNDEYVLRGQRVNPMNPLVIEQTAKRAMAVMNINKRIINKMDVFIDDLWTNYRINVEVNEDEEWFGFAEALCDPSKFTISIPNALYTRITKLKDREALFIFFHELGHLLLGHKPALHYSLFPPTKYEDAEWQADFFAETILEKLGWIADKQLKLILE
ncbi:DUF4344 domain-containing metallopeptidase [Acinetobacter pittii]|uniref:ImmA/IrrE family metallo-endopeptidase n=1 Tax=Acinetobacter pittii TaxID=48296 RepID=UPI00083FC1C9|nr:ImmA/IrrE family metallo-endopeptidase [Acinetobacter pittii]MCE6000300.1 DUF4344 domain-containing metallopeptidase [Acinetobacter pittii]MDP7846830.1 ImmA/IrrE family metallo-endopeptidase [Acinetobacter pittii]MDP7870187.1 ImmA/IrrE family metallo-endopeptidase [Acinetobacter pittii]ODM01601.1 hypothetical protein AXH22_08195 [Acinetobacter pittii]OTU26096.1 hypothetical protein CAT60_08220 [Acinetobacter pittii]